MKLDNINIVKDLSFVNSSLKEQNIEDIRNCIELATQNFILDINKIDQKNLDLLARGMWYRGSLINYIREIGYITPFLKNNSFCFAINGSGLFSIKRNTTYKISTKKTKLEKSLSEIYSKKNENDLFPETLQKILINESRYLFLIDFDLMNLKIESLKINLLTICNENIVSIYPISDNYVREIKYMSIDIGKKCDKDSELQMPERKIQRKKTKNL